MDEDKTLTMKNIRPFSVGLLQDVFQKIGHDFWHWVPVDVTNVYDLLVYGQFRHLFHIFEIEVGVNDLMGEHFARGEKGFTVRRVHLAFG